MKHSSVLAFALLGACTTTDDGPPVATVTGVVEIDAAIPGATVFIDYNDDNLLGSNEPRTTTDATGHYVLSWDNWGPAYPHTVGAIVDAGSTHVGLALHMRAPIGEAVGTFEGSAVISPLSTLVASEMAYDPALTRAAAEAKVVVALSASQLPLSGQPLDVTADYVASADSVQLRHVAGAVAAIVSAAADRCTAAQSIIDCNDAMLFDPAIVAMDKQLTAIADGTVAFAMLTTDQQTDVEQHPGSYRGYFIDTTALANDIEQQLEAAALDLAAEIFASIKDKLVEQLEEAVVQIVAEELIAEILG